MSITPRSDAQWDLYQDLLEQGMDSNRAWLESILATGVGVEEGDICPNCGTVLP
jgi:hypothetical protein